HEPAIEQGEPGRHEEHEPAAGEHPRGIARVDHGHVRRVDLDRLRIDRPRRHKSQSHTKRRPKRDLSTKLHREITFPTHDGFLAAVTPAPRPCFSRTRSSALQELARGPTTPDQPTVRCRSIAIRDAIGGLEKDREKARTRRSVRSPPTLVRRCEYGSHPRGAERRSCRR